MMARRNPFDIQETPWISSSTKKSGKSGQTSGKRGFMNALDNAQKIGRPTNRSLTRTPNQYMSETPIYSMSETPMRSLSERPRSMARTLESAKSRKR